MCQCSSNHHQPQLSSKIQCSLCTSPDPFSYIQLPTETLNHIALFVCVSLSLSLFLGECQLTYDSYFLNYVLNFCKYIIIISLNCKPSVFSSYTLSWKLKQWIASSSIFQWNMIVPVESTNTWVFYPISWSKHSNHIIATAWGKRIRNIRHHNTYFWNILHAKFHCCTDHVKNENSLSLSCNKQNTLICTMYTVGSRQVGSV